MVLLVVVALSSSCIPLAEPSLTVSPDHPVACEDVVDVRIHSFPFTAASKPAILAWIQDQYGLAEKDISISHRPPTAELPDYWEWEMGWRFADRDYRIAFLVSGRPDVVVTVQWQSEAPTLGDVLRCLGQPSAYHAYYQSYPEAVWTTLDVLYPEKGLEFHGFIQSKVSYIDERVRMRLATYAEPGSQENFVAHVYMQEPGTEANAKSLSAFRPWPGDISKVMIDQAN